MLDYGESEPGAARIARARFVHAIEPLEHARQSSSGIPGPRPSTEMRDNPAASGATRRRGCRALGRVRDRVRDEVAQRVVQLGGIAAHRFRRRLRSPTSSAAGATRAPRQVGDHAVDQVRMSHAMMSSFSWPASRRASRSRSLTSRSIRSVCRVMMSRNRRLSSALVSPSDSAST